MGTSSHTAIILTIWDLNLLETDVFLLYFAFQTTFWSDTILRQTNSFVSLLSLERALLGQHLMMQNNPQM